MGTEHPEIERTASIILLSTPAYFQNASDHVVCNKLLDYRKDRMPAIAVRDRDSHLVPLAGRDDLVGFGGSPAEGLFHVNARNAGRDGLEHHVAMLTNVPWGNSDNVWLHLRKHLPVVRKSPGHPQSRQRAFQPIGICIGDCDDLRPRQSLPHPIDSMAVVTASRMANDADTQSGVGSGSADRIRNTGSRSRGKKCASFHLDFNFSSLSLPTVRILSEGLSVTLSVVYLAP